MHSACAKKELGLKGATSANVVAAGGTSFFTSDGSASDDDAT
jgi:hypothetical protein